MDTLQVLQTVVNELGSVCIPAAYMEQIGVPVYNSRQKLIALFNEIQKAAEKNEETPTEEAGAEDGSVLPGSGDSD